MTIKSNTAIRAIAQRLKETASVDEAKVKEFFTSLKLKPADVADLIKHGKTRQSDDMGECWGYHGGPDDDNPYQLVQRVVTAAKKAKATIGAPQISKHYKYVTNSAWVLPEGGPAKHFTCSLRGEEGDCSAIYLSDKPY